MTSARGGWSVKGITEDGGRKDCREEAQAGGGMGSLLAKSLGRPKCYFMSTVEIIASEVRELEPKQQSQVLRFLQAQRKEKEQNE